MGAVRRYRSSLLLFSLVLCLMILGFIYRFGKILHLPFSFKAPAIPLAIRCNNGRLGNQMCTYATLYGISSLNNRQVIGLPCNIDRLKDIFVGPSEVTTERKNDTYLKLNPWRILPYLKPGDESIPDNSTYLTGYPYPCSFTFFDHVGDDIRREFQFHERFIQFAQTVLHKANSDHLSNPTFVGVHVRRGDYQKRWLEIFKGVPVNMEYFRQSFQYFRQKYENVIFVVISEDRQWCREKISGELGVHVPEDVPSPAHDLAILANCNHSIMTYGTFGFWGSYLAGGEVLYFDKFLLPNTSFTLHEFIFEKMYPPYWKGIVTVNASDWFQQTTTQTYDNVTKL